MNNIATPENAPVVPTNVRPELKRIPYRGAQHPYGAHDGIIDYVILPGDRCVFSGVSAPGQAMSTINAAENIIMAICDREEYEPNELRFFDLQTCRGYHFTLEQYEIDELKFAFRGGEVEGISWHGLLECPAEVLELFNDHIGQIVVPVLSHDEAQRKGFGAEGVYFYAGFDSPEEALADIRECHRPKPNELHTLAIVDLATMPGRRSTDGHRFAICAKNPDQEVHESRWNIKSVADTRQTVKKYKHHHLSREELKELADLLQRELACSPDAAVPFSHHLEYLMRAIAAILDTDTHPDYIWNKFRGGVKDLFISLCDKMPGFRKEAQRDCADLAETFTLRGYQ